VLCKECKVVKLRKRNYRDFLKKCLLDFAIHQTCSTREIKGDPNITHKYFLNVETAGYGFHFYQNRSKNQATLHEYLQYTENDGVILLYNQHNLDQFWSTVMPN